MQIQLELRDEHINTIAESLRFRLACAERSLARVEDPDEAARLHDVITRCTEALVEVESQEQVAWHTSTPEECAVRDAHALGA